jgi:hypothetical protein
MEHVEALGAAWEMHSYPSASTKTLIYADGKKDTVGYVTTEVYQLRYPIGYDCQVTQIKLDGKIIASWCHHHEPTDGGAHR